MSLLAIASISIPVISLIHRFVLIFCVDNRCLVVLQVFLGLMLTPISFLLLIAPVLGILAFIEIIMSRGLRKGYILATLGILMFVPASMWGPRRALARVRAESSIIICQRTMMKLGEAMRAYSNNHNNRYPEANRWCDLVLEYVDVNDMDMGFFTYGDKMNHYAMNPNVKPSSPIDIVVLFETKSGWNQFGGPELLTTEHHQGFGCNILFNDGHVEFIKPKRFGDIRWSDGQK